MPSASAAATRCEPLRSMPDVSYPSPRPSRRRVTLDAGILAASARPKEEEAPGGRHAGSAHLERADDHLAATLDLGCPRPTDEVLALSLIHISEPTRLG